MSEDGQEAVRREIGTVPISTTTPAGVPVAGALSVGIVGVGSWASAAELNALLTCRHQGGK